MLKIFEDRAKAIPKEHKAVFTGGKPGAGKSSSLHVHKVNDKNWMTIDSDQVKEAMIDHGLAPDIPGLTPFESSALIHQESTDLANTLIHRLSNDGTNIVVDGTMAWGPYINKTVGIMQAKNYRVKGMFVEVSPETSVRRANQRHREGIENFLARGKGQGGRYVPRSVLAAEPRRNRNVFEAEKDVFDDWTVWDNDVDGRDPILLASKNGEAVEFSHRGNVDYYEYLEEG